jgi:hypothetical protein
VVCSLYGVAALGLGRSGAVPWSVSVAVSVAASAGGRAGGFGFRRDLLLAGFGMALWWWLCGGVCVGM